MIRFNDPIFLLLLLVPPLLWLCRSRSRVISPPGMVTLVRSTSIPLSLRARYLPLVNRVLFLLVWSCAVLALARPQYGERLEQQLSEGRDIFLTLDTSASMEAMDFKLNDEEVDRLSVLKSVVHDFVSKRSDDRLGVIAFGTQVATQCPLTTDHETVNRVIEGLEIGMAGDGTAIGDALGVSLKRLKPIPGKSKVIILVTDGKSNSGVLAPLEAAELASQLGIKIYTVGIGGIGRAPIKRRGPFGSKIYIELEYDEATLKKIAAKTGGRYFQAKNSAQLSEIYDEIDALEVRTADKLNLVQFEERSQPLLVTTLLLWITWEILGLTLLRVFPGDG